MDAPETKYTRLGDTYIAYQPRRRRWYASEIRVSNLSDGCFFERFAGMVASGTETIYAIQRCRGVSTDGRY